MKRKVRYIPLFLLFLFLGSLAYADWTTQQKYWFFGWIDWHNLPSKTNYLGDPLIDSNNRINYVDAKNDSYGKYFHFIIGAASKTATTAVMDCAGFSKCTVQQYICAAQSTAFRDNSNIYAENRTGKDYIIRSSMVPRSIIYNATPISGIFMPISVTAGIIGFASTSATNYGTSAGTTVIEPTAPIGAMGPITKLGSRSYDLCGAKSIILSVSDNKTAYTYTGGVKSVTSVFLIGLSR